MWASLPIVLATLTLAGPVTARHQKRADTLAENGDGEILAATACAGSTVTVYEAKTVTAPTRHHHHHHHSSETTHKATDSAYTHSSSASFTFSDTLTVSTLWTSSSKVIATSISSITEELPTSVIVTSSLAVSASSASASSSTATTLSTKSTHLFTSISLAPSMTSILPSPTATPSATSIPFLRGVNLGGWLVLEKWMDYDAFTGAFAGAVDQYTFDSIDGAAEALETHWSSFFVESDIQALAGTGINALRIPIGYWAYNNTGTPYLQGADAYLEKAIEWARDAGMYVWVDCHGSPGSQNGFDNSGHAGDVEWQQAENLDKSISVLKTMAAKYGAEEYADVVVGLEMTNEPISWGNNDFSVTQSWAKDAYAAVKAEVTNPNLVIVMHDGFEGASSWTDVGADLIGSGPRTFGIDSHLYQLYTDAYNALDQSQHITAACGWADELAGANAIMPTYVGEWSAATNICVNPDGSTSAGTSCSVSGCKCQSESFADWSDAMIKQVRMYVEAQLDVFESSSSGYFLWALKGPGGWGFTNGIGNGIIPNPVTSRLYPDQCDGGSSETRRIKRGNAAF